MKKHILFIVLATSLAVGALQAQDTLWMKPAPLSNYFSNSWIDTTGSYVASTLIYSNPQIIARRFICKDVKQKVYGIAAMMVNFDSLTFVPSSDNPSLQPYLNTLFPADPSFTHCEESLMLFQYSGSTVPSMQQLGDSLPVHMLNTPASYFVMSNTPVVSYFDTFPKPVYECYFSVPQTVYDTFYVGFSQSDREYSSQTNQWQLVRPNFGCLAFGYSDMGNLDEVVAVLKHPNGDNPSEWIFFNNYNRLAYYIFPIIAPPDTTVNPGDTIVNPNDTIINPGDTIINPGDTLAIRTNDILYRYTALQPNPASDKVKVLSSFGISRIEAYDLKGRKVSEFRTPNSEFSITLDVSSWPRGTYLLRITTPAGPTTKKLLLR